MELQYRRYLDLSTSHITQTDMLLLQEWDRRNHDEPNRLMCTICNYPEGCFVSVVAGHSVLHQLETLGFSKEFIAIYKQCQKDGVMVIQLDAAADHHELPRFSW